MVHRPSKSRDQRTPGPLSPRRTAALRSPGDRSRGYSREGSDGAPSMGSSYSELDGKDTLLMTNFFSLSDDQLNCPTDASVTQSALEEALASHMDRGGGSRFSISQAFRSRYTPSSGQ